MVGVRKCASRKMLRIRDPEHAENNRFRLAGQAAVLHHSQRYYSTLDDHVQTIPIQTRPPWSVSMYHSIFRRPNSFSFSVGESAVGKSR